jgi:hypothetical protein
MINYFYNFILKIDKNYNGNFLKKKLKLFDDDLINSEFNSCIFTFSLSV